MEQCMQLLSDCSIQMQKDQCFINYTKAFDKVHEEFLEGREKIDLHTKDIHVIFNFYWEWIVYMCIEYELQK